jgi:hypothetical protein
MHSYLTGYHCVWLPCWPPEGAQSYVGLACMCKHPNYLSPGMSKGWERPSRPPLTVHPGEGQTTPLVSALIASLQGPEEYRPETLQEESKEETHRCKEAPVLADGGSQTAPHLPDPCLFLRLGFSALNSKIRDGVWSKHVPPLPPCPAAQHYPPSQVGLGLQELLVQGVHWGASLRW